MSHTTPSTPSRNPSTNGPLRNHPPPPAAPTTVQKFLGIPTTTSVHFACTLFVLVELAAFAIVRSGAVAFLDPPNPYAVLLFACLFSFLFWHQRRCIRDLLTRLCPDSEAGCTSSATGSVAAEAVMGPEGEEVLKLFDKLQTPIWASMACIMLLLGWGLGTPGAAIAAGGVVSLAGFWWFSEICRNIRLEMEARKKGREEPRREEGHRHHQAVEGSAVPRSSESREDVASGGAETRERDLRRRLSCIPEEEEGGPSGQGGDNRPPADLVLSQQAQDLVWNRVRFLAARERLKERRRRKLLVRRAMRGVQGGSTQSRNASEGGGFSAMPPESAQRSREEVSEEKDRQGQGGGGSKRVWERRGAISGESKDGRGTSDTFSSWQPSSTTMMLTMGSNPSTSVPQQQTFPAMDHPSHLPATMDRTDLQQKQQQQQQARHIEEMNHLIRTKDSEIATLRAQMEGITKHFRAREEACGAAHAAEVANAWRNAQVLFEKVGKLEGKLAAGSSAREEVGVERAEEWVGGGSTAQEEKMGRELGGFAREEKGEGSGDDSVSRRQQQQQQQQKDQVVEDDRESTKQDPKLNPLLCQNTGCFCHFPVVAPQHSQQQQQQQRQEFQTSTDEDEDAIVSESHVDEVNGDETNGDDDDAFTIILESSPPSLSSSSSSSCGDERPGTLTPAEGSEISWSELEMGSSAFDSESEPDGLDERIHV
ncbi:hypothetical protein KC343_g11868 [Hortaea werneckii]|nr:hypothetical protein KC352_g21473 [Hortaea werneckii]KAI7569201.1 hypothetical protein KC317_g3530 [Hortaea werneckii]KAI7610616.1 hypothetical protein KC343_g11868 [Hortaea werneckii]KAI7622689.1 hypothetical protein KC346_g3086 [Hortaea werneckii]KAI7676832.1 hypothetical protein KC319_g4274 [Hortaea werneckii]